MFEAPKALAPPLPQITSALFSVPLSDAFHGYEWVGGWTQPVPKEIVSVIAEYLTPVYPPQLSIEPTSNSGSVLLHALRHLRPVMTVFSTPDAESWP